MTLYERLGGAEGIARLVDYVWEEHCANPIVSARYKDSDPEKVKARLREFIAWGTGGAAEYKGKSMREAHRAMNISEAEFYAVLEDSWKAMERAGVDASTRNEVLGLLFSLREEVLHQ